MTSASLCVVTLKVALPRTPPTARAPPSGALAEVPAHAVGGWFGCSTHRTPEAERVRAVERVAAKEKLLVKKKQNKTEKPKTVAMRIKSYVADTHLKLIHIGN